jgi:hypothetical protein
MDGRRIDQPAADNRRIVDKQCRSGGTWWTDMHADHDSFEEDRCDRAQLLATKEA